jgi:protein-disulfide isomerase
VSRHTDRHIRALRCDVMSNPSQAPVRLAVPVSERDHALGPADAPVTLVEFGDYECPYCRRADPVVKRIRQQLGDRLRFVFRNYPQNSVHPHASVAAQAAEAAAAQGKFWQMHDELYEHQDDLAEQEISSFALRAGLEIYKFQADLGSERFAERVLEDFLGGQQSGVKRTPTFFINGIRYDGELEYEPMLNAIERAERESR